MSEKYQQLIDHLPEVAAAISAPLAKTDKITIVSTGGDGNGVGASKISQDTAHIIAQIPAMVEGLTGVDLVEAIKKLPPIKTNGQDTGIIEATKNPDKASDETISSDEA